MSEAGADGRQVCKQVQEILLRWYGDDHDGDDNDDDDDDNHEDDDDDGHEDGDGDYNDNGKNYPGSSVTTQAPAASQRMKLLKRLNQKLFF